MKQYRLAIIGTGRIGFLLEHDKKREQPASHSSAFSRNKRIMIIAGCDIDKKRLELWHKCYPDANIYTNHNKLLEKENPDIVVIAVNEEAHLQITLDVIKKNPELIVLEKPAAPNLEMTRIIKGAVNKYKVPIIINHERRFSEDYKKVKELLKNKKIGKINSVHANLWSGLKVWHDKCRDNGACSLIHDGTHLVDIIHYLFDIRLKNPVIDNVVKNRKGEVVSLNVHYKFNKDGIIYLEICGGKKYFGFELDIRGDNGRIVVGNGYFKFYESLPSPYYSNFYSLKKNKKVKRPRKTKYFSNMAANCVNYLDGKEGLVSTLDDGTEVIKALYDIVDLL